MADLDGPRSAAYQAVMAAPNVLTGNAWTNARIWRGVEAALDAADVPKPSSSETERGDR